MPNIVYLTPLNLCLLSSKLCYFLMFRLVLVFYCVAGRWHNNAVIRAKRTKRMIKALVSALDVRPEKIIKFIINKLIVI